MPIKEILEGSNPIVMYKTSDNSFAFQVGKENQPTIKIEWMNTEEGDVEAMLKHAISKECWNYHQKFNQSS